MLFLSLGCSHAAARQITAKIGFLRTSLARQPLTLTLKAITFQEFQLLCEYMAKTKARALFAPASCA
jgi:hypothetical protein